MLRDAAVDDRSHFSLHFAPVDADLFASIGLPQKGSRYDRQVSDSKASKRVVRFFVLRRKLPTMGT